MMRRAGAGLLALAGLAAGACTAPATPAEVAVRYGRALYAGDAAAIHRLVSAADRRVKDEAAIGRQQRSSGGFAGELVRQLSTYVTGTPVKTSATADRVRMTLTFSLPDANARAIRTLVLDWDEARLDALPPDARRRIGARLAELHRAGTLPTLDGDETFELVRDPDGWRVFLNWADGVRVRFVAAVAARLPVRVSFSPSEVVVSPGERVRVTVRAENVGPTEITARVGHRIEPAPAASSLALLECPLFLPITLAPGERREVTSEYLLLADVPADVKAFQVTYRFPADADVATRP